MKQKTIDLATENNVVRRVLEPLKPACGEASRAVPNAE